MASKRVLIVDDEENIGRSLRMILEREGYAVNVCRTVAEFKKHPDAHRAGVAGRAEDKDALTRLERHPAAQRDPRGHRRIHRGGDLGHVDALRQLDRAARVDERLVRHRAHDVVVGREVDEPAVGQPPDAVDARDHRQRAAARVVPSRGAGADARVQARGEDVGEHLAW